jgi:hypothetical protein
MDWLKKYQDEGQVRKSNTIPEVTVYGKRQYSDALDKLTIEQQKYVEQMAKYKKDSIEYQYANKAYQDSLEHYNIAKPVYDKGYFDRNAYDRGSEHYHKKYGSFGKFWGDKDNWPEIRVLNQAKFDGKVTDRTDSEYGWGVPVFTKPKVTPTTPTPPGSPPADVKYDPTYENLNMRSLWPEMVKQDTTAKIGTLHQLDPLFNKGFTYGEAQKFPEEIKKKYKLDYPIKFEDGGDLTAKRDATQVVVPLSKKVSQEEQEYFNPKVQDITTGYPLQVALYKNQWLFDTPIIGNIIKNTAKKYASNSGGGEYITKDANKVPYRGTHSMKSSINLIDQYFDKSGGLTESKYSPKSDYLSFLPSYSIKTKEAEDKINNEKMMNLIHAELYPEFNFHSNIDNLFVPNTDSTYQNFIKNRSTIYNNRNTSAAERLLNVNLAGHKTGMSWDRSIDLPYTSVSDAWDFEPNSYSKKWGEDKNSTPEEREQLRQLALVQSALLHRAGNPFKIYDRFYFDPKTQQYITDDSIQSLKRSKGITPIEDEALNKDISKYFPNKKDGGQINSFEDGGSVKGFQPKQFSFDQQDPEFLFKRKYNTELSEQEDKQFNDWVKQESLRQGRNILMDIGAYDVKGFWKSGDHNNMDGDNHGSDRWKKPNHPTFSNQSIYHGTGGFYGGEWGEDGSYHPSRQTRELYSSEYYQQLFGNEPHRPEHLNLSRSTNFTPSIFEDGGEIQTYVKRDAPWKYFAEDMKKVIKGITPLYGKEVEKKLDELKSKRFYSSHIPNYGFSAALDEQDRLMNLENDIEVIDTRKVPDNRRMSHGANSETVRKLAAGALKRGLDPNTVLAMALQETGISNINPLHQNIIDGVWRNEGYTPNSKKNADIIDHNLNFLTERLSEAKRLGKTDEAHAIQSWNGYGKMPPGYYGRDEVIDMWKDPVYGKRIIALRDSAIATTPAIQAIIDEERSRHDKEYEDGGNIQKSKGLTNFTQKSGWLDKYREL